MNYYITTDNNHYIVSTCETTQMLGPPWIAITAAQYPGAQVPGATYTASTSTVNAPAANYNLVGVGNAQIAKIGAGLANAVNTPVSFTTAGGVSTSFANSQNNRHMLAEALTIWGSSNWPSTYFLRDVNNIKVAITYADAVSLGQTLGAAILDAENKYEVLVAQILGYVNGGGTVSEIQGVTF